MRDAEIGEPQPLRERKEHDALHCDARGKREDLYNLEGIIELNKGHFEKTTPKRTLLKRGMGSQKQANMAVMAEPTSLEDIASGQRMKHFRCLKMKALPTPRTGSVNDTIEEHLDERSIVFFEKSTGYVNIVDFVDFHFLDVYNKKAELATLRRVHLNISNAKRNFLDVSHKISGKNLQGHLHEFCEKVNRRY